MNFRERAQQAIGHVAVETGRFIFGSRAYPLPEKRPLYSNVENVALSVGEATRRLKEFGDSAPEVMPGLQKVVKIAPTQLFTASADAKNIRHRLGATVKTYVGLEKDANGSWKPKLEKGEYAVKVLEDGDVVSVNVSEIVRYPGTDIPVTGYYDDTGDFNVVEKGGRAPQGMKLELLVPVYVQPRSNAETKYGFQYGDSHADGKIYFAKKASFAVSLPDTLSRKATVTEVSGEKMRIFGRGVVILDVKPAEVKGRTDKDGRTEEGAVLSYRVTGRQGLAPENVDTYITEAGYEKAKANGDLDAYRKQIETTFSSLSAQ